MQVHRTAVLGLTLAFAACSPEGSEPDAATPAGDEGTASARSGLVILTHDRGETGVAVSGQMIAWRAPSRSVALHALTLPEQAWLVDAPPRSGCRLVTAPHETPAGSSFDLLSVGELNITAPVPGLPALHLAPRDLPPVSFALSGVVYDADAPEALPYQPGGLYHLDAAGDELGGLSGAVHAPEPVRLEDMALDEQGLRVQWSGGEAFVVLSRDAGPWTVGVICRGAEGEVSVPDAALDHLGQGEAQVLVARVARTSLRVDGLNEAELVFVSRDSAEVRLRDGLAASGDGP
ncbi:MAG: hypothetical protein KC620_15430 [Myxococcales bacterium]|nr:hypothetical protein [Myxococcales bacterium]